MRIGRGSLLARLERLENQAAPVQLVKLRFGQLRRLPESYRGERHVVVAKQLPNVGDQEWVELPGPAPDPNPRLRPAQGVPTRIVFCAFARRERRGTS